MSSRMGSRGPGRPGVHRQSRPAVRPCHVLVLGSFAMAASGLLLLSLTSTSPQGVYELDGRALTRATSLKGQLADGNSRRGRGGGVSEQVESGGGGASETVAPPMPAGTLTEGGIGAEKKENGSARGVSADLSSGIQNRDVGERTEFLGESSTARNSQSMNQTLNKDVFSHVAGEEHTPDPDTSSSRRANRKLPGRSWMQGLRGSRDFLNAAHSARALSNSDETSQAERKSSLMSRKSRRKDIDSQGRSTSSSRSGSSSSREEASRAGQEGKDTSLVSLSHSMDDEELLWRASFVSLRDPSRRIGPRKVAFLFSFDRELFFAPLWAKFLEKHEGRFSVYLHSSAGNTSTAALPSVFQNRLVPIETRTSPGGEPFPHMFAVDAGRRLVANALLDLGNEWFLIVCDLCIPLHNFDFFYDYLASSPERSFVPHQVPGWQAGLDRFVASCFEPLVVQDQWRKGGPWMGLTRRLALDLVADVKYYDRFASCCQPVKRGSAEPCFPLEHYMATVLPLLAAVGPADVQPEEVTNWSTVFEDWWTEPWAGRPFVYNESFVSEKLIKTMRRCHLGNLCHLQGAHFEPATLPKLLNISSILGF